ncbi:MAG: hypothetical protein HC836_49735 [Richelia sp. RM2_1_2]|nr:hypothetical protein [Richelia sp. RM2_1_2]
MTNNYENSTPQQELIPVYEFSRGFDNPHYSEKHQRWVSGGFSEKNSFCKSSRSKRNSR